MANRMLPLLRPGASVVLVAGHLPGGGQTPDDRHARKSLLRVLAQAVASETAEAGARTVVVDEQCSPAEIPRSPSVAALFSEVGCRSSTASPGRRVIGDMPRSRSVREPAGRQEVA